jgi:hypothetical protein
VNETEQLWRDLHQDFLHEIDLIPHVCSGDGYWASDHYVVWGNKAESQDNVNQVRFILHPSLIRHKEYRTSLLFIPSKERPQIKRRQ